MAKMTRRGFMAATMATGAMRFVPAGVGIVAKLRRDVGSPNWFMTKALA
ncbi:hypothetical protein N9P81_00145 [bacterium]|nr:hypothetical protein [bacterium]